MKDRFYYLTVFNNQNTSPLPIKHSNIMSTENLDLF